MKAFRAAAVLVVFISLGSPLAAQQPPGCTSPVHAQFDFWVGTWTVSNPAGAVIGRSTIERVATGCAVLETWTDANGIEGRSLNFHDPESDTWHQVWMGANGSPLRLEGGSDQPGRMILTGAARATAQGSVRDRITWTLRDDGSVEQRWETSNDDGASWQTGFLGIYRR